MQNLRQGNAWQRRGANSNRGIRRRGADRPLPGNFRSKNWMSAGFAEGRLAQVMPPVVRFLDKMISLAHSPGGHTFSLSITVKIVRLDNSSNGLK